jgi:hypothetical protein
MEEYIPRELFTKKHLRLTNIAKIANVLFWILLIFTVLQLIITIWQLSNNLPSNLPDTPINNLYQNAFFRLYGLVSNFIYGFVNLLVLKSIHLALNMIVETDINYRMNKPEPEVSDEE